MKLGQIVNIEIGVGVTVPGVVCDVWSEKLVTIFANTSQLLGFGFGNSVTVDYSLRKNGEWRRKGCDSGWTVVDLIQ